MLFAAAAAVFSSLLCLSDPFSIISICSESIFVFQHNNRWCYYIIFVVHCRGSSNMCDELMAVRMFKCSYRRVYVKWPIVWRRSSLIFLSGFRIQFRPLAFGYAESMLYWMKRARRLFGYLFCQRGIINSKCHHTHTHRVHATDAHTQQKHNDGICSLFDSKYYDQMR